MVGACQQNSGIFLVRGGGAGLGPDEMPVGAEAGLAAGSERPGTGQDAGDQITGAGSGTSRDRGRQRARSEMPVVPRLGWQRNLQEPGRRQPNQLKRKRSIISSSNSGFSKSFSLVMIRLLCSQNPASW